MCNLTEQLLAAELLASFRLIPRSLLILVKIVCLGKILFILDSLGYSTIYLIGAHIQEIVELCEIV